jgi:hypothetical protein
MMSDTLNDTFSRWFDDTPNGTCEYCNETENLSPLGSATAGAQMWICPTHKAEKEAADRERTQKAQDDLAQMIAMNDWEE